MIAQAIEALVTREQPGGSDDSFGKSQSISLTQALELFTVNSAAHMGREHELGRVKAGMLADLVVIDRDPFAIPATNLHQVRVEQTIPSRVWPGGVHPIRAGQLSPRAA